MFYRLLLVALILLMAGCTGDTGPAGVNGTPGAPGAPQPVKLLLLSTESVTNMKEMIVTAYNLSLFPLGTIIDHAQLQAGIPTLDELLEYDCILCWTTNTLASRVVVGDRLAEYVDAGGGLVLAQGAYSQTNLGPIEGRIMTQDGYSPLRPAPASLDISNRKVDFFSLTFPLHPIFNGTNALNLCFQSQPNYSAPLLAPNSTVIALDVDCAPTTDSAFNCIAINDSQNVISLNIYPNWHVTYQTYPDPPQLIANCLLYVAGAIPSPTAQ